MGMGVESSKQHRAQAFLRNWPGGTRILLVHSWGVTPITHVH